MIRRFRGWGQRLWWACSKGLADPSAEDELRSHIELHVSEQVAAGLPAAEARRTAMLQLGGVLQAIEMVRDQRGVDMVRGAWSDMTLAARRLVRAPVFAVTAIATLALGIGASSAVFSVARAGLMTPLPYPDVASRVMLFVRWNAFDKTWLADAEIVDFRRMARTLTDVAGWTTQQANLTGGGRPVRATIGYVTANTFRVLGVAPRIGRALSAADDQPHAAPVVVLGDDLWRSRYAADPGIVGRAIMLDDEPVMVVGVMPPGFLLPTDYTDDAASPSQAWRALQIDESQLSRSHSFYGAALLAPGETPASASDEIRAIFTRLTADGQYQSAAHFSGFAVGLDDEIRGPVRPALLLLAGGVFCLLLIACANVSNLLLVRGDAQLKELTIRRALGASPGRLRRQLAFEGLVLTAAGAMAGLPLALALVAVPRAFDIPTLRSVQASQLDWSMVLTAVVAAAVTTIVFSVVPLAGVGDTRAAAVLRAASAATTAAPSRTRLRRVLVLAQVALAMLLLSMAGLMLKSLDGLRRIELGFDANQLLTARVSLPQRKYATPQQAAAFYQALADEAGRLPGVAAAGIVRLLPLATTIGDWGLDIDGFDEGTAQTAKGDWQVATSGAFAAMGTKLLEGRTFERTDRGDTEPVAVVNRTMALRYWPSEDRALGGRIRLGSSPSRPWIRVVGIVADERHNGITGAIKEKFYIPQDQWGLVTNGNAVRDAYVVLRTTGDPMLLAKPLTEAVQRLDPDLPVASARTMADVVASSFATTRLSGVLLVVFAASALLLAGIGLYGVLAYVVSQRTREIGIRLALGSNPRAILGLVLRQGLGLAGAGVLVGTAAALLLTRVMSGLLYEVTPTDPATLATMAALLMAVALAACMAPGRRAAGLDPMVALKEG